MQTRAAVLSAVESDWQIWDLTVDAPKAGEVLVEFAFGGLCHTDVHFRHGNGETLPMVGGHEGAGVVLEIGDGVTGLAVGDHVVALPSPTCGRCYFCARGRQTLCLSSRRNGSGRLPDGTFRFHAKDGRALGALCVLGTFARHAVVSPDSLVAIDPAVPLEVAALISCGVLTGWGAAVNTAVVRPGDNVLVIGTGGVGLNAIQGAAFCGAREVVAVDGNEDRLEMARHLGATQASTDIAEATKLGRQINPMAGGFDHVIICVGDVTADVVRTAYEATALGGAVVIASLSDSFDDTSISLSASRLVLSERRVLGSLVGSSSARRDIPLLADLYLSGRIELGSLVTTRYALDQINEGFADMLAGRNARGVIQHA